jgi:putative solute:sodium symporter small subunit
MSRRDMLASAPEFWLRLRRLTLRLLLCWLLITVLPIWFARELARINFFGWPLSFYLAAQGVILGFLALIGLYAWSTSKLEAAARQAEHGE